PFWLLPLVLPAARLIYLKRIHRLDISAGSRGSGSSQCVCSRPSRGSLDTHRARVEAREYYVGRLISAHASVGHRDHRHSALWQEAARYCPVSRKEHG